MDPTAATPPAVSASGGIGVVIENTAHIETATPGLESFYSLIDRMQPVGETRRAIDLGSGGGRDSKFLSAKGWEVTAADIKKEAGDVFSNHAHIKFVQGSLAAVGAEPNSVGLINCQRVTPFMSLQQLRVMLAQAAELLSPAGHLAISFFGPNHSWLNKSGHENKLFYDLEAIQKELRGCGLKLAAKPDKIDKPQRAANGEHVERWHEILVLAAKEAPVKEPALAARLRASIECDVVLEGPSTD